LVADTLRHLADNEIDSDYFAITSTNENGTEIDHEMAITDYALQAAGTVDELVAALESAEKRIAELSASHSKLRDTMAGIHNTIRMDGGYTPLTAILNAAKRAYEESASAAGIRIKGE
ncbi:ead/Ea22-like family protein, partial [Escherichia coli]